MVRPFFHGIVASSAGGGPSVPLGLAVSWPGEASSQLKLTWSQPADTAGGITGYKIIKDGSVLVADTGSTSTTYTATGLTTSQSYSFQVAGISNSGEGLPCSAVSKSTIAAPSISYSASAATYFTSAQQGYGIYQFYGSGSFYIASNADSSPISVYAVGGGGATGYYWSSYGGGGGGGVYVAENLTNIPVGSSHTMSFTIGAGASGGSYGTGGSDTSVTNLHWNGSSWSTAYAGYGESAGWMQGPTNGGGGAGSSGNTSNAGHSGSYGNTGGTGGQGATTSGGQYGASGNGAGGGGGGSVTTAAAWPGTGGTGGTGTSSSSSSNGGAGGTGLAFSSSEGFGSIGNNSATGNGNSYVIPGIGGGGGGGAYRSSYYSGNYGHPYQGYGNHGGGTPQTGKIAWVASAIWWNSGIPGHLFQHGAARTGGGAASAVGGGNGSGGSGCVYVRVHT